MNKKSYDAQSVIAYALKGETYAEAKARLEALRAEGQHPSQLPRKSKRERRAENRNAAHNV